MRILHYLKKALISAGVCALAFSMAACAAPVFLDSSYSASSLEEYDEAVVREMFGGDLDSNFAIFPDTVPEDAEVTLFEASFRSGLFDTDGRLLLGCRYDDEDFAAEIERLAGLEMVIKNGAGSETWTNHILYDEDSYELPAYVANAGFGNTYEYALIDEDSREIVYIYLAYPDPNTFEYPEYLLSWGPEAYNEENTLEAFSMYNHSFDGGRTYVEFDD